MGGGEKVWAKVRRKDEMLRLDGEGVRGVGGVWSEDRRRRKRGEGE